MCSERERKLFVEKKEHFCEQKNSHSKRSVTKLLLHITLMVWVTTKVCDPVITVVSELPAEVETFLNESFTRQHRFKNKGMSSVCKML